MIDEDKLKSKIEGLKSNLIHGACSSQVAMETRCKEEAYNEVLTILNSMQKEPNLSNIERTVKDWKEMSVSKKLKEELDNWRHQHFHGKRDKHASGEYLERITQLDLAHHFAEWQKQQMMKDAIETTLSKGLEEDYNIKGKYKAYIIVIKED